MKSALLILMCVFCILACQEKPIAKQEPEKMQEFEPRHSIDNLVYMDSLIACAIWKGDEKAYALAEAHYYRAQRQEEFLWTALTVANKYNNSQACYCVYNLINGWRIGAELKNLDPKNKNFALYYLLKSYELGEDNAKSKVEEIFEGKPIPKSSYYMQEYAKE